MYWFLSGRESRSTHIPGRKNYRRKDGEENQQQSETSVSLSFKQFKPKLSTVSHVKKYRDILPLIFQIISEKFQTFSISPMQEVPKIGIPSYCHQGFKNKAS